MGCSIAAVYLLDANFVNDGSKFIAGTMQALSAMTMLEVPHVNVRAPVRDPADQIDAQSGLQTDSNRVRQDCTGFSRLLRSVSARCNRVSTGP
jgi:hypothetical protein